MSDGAERRRSPRVELVGQLRGELVSLDVPIRVREISLGGMSIESPTAFDVNSEHSFVLTLGDGAGVVVKGRVAYCRPMESPEGFVSGIQFVDEDSADSDGDVGGLMTRIR